MPRLNRILAAFLSLIVLASIVAPVSAQNQGVSGSGLSISPTLAQFNLTPGQSTTFAITLKDSTVGSISAQGFVNDFTSDGTSGNPKLVLNTTQPGPNSIRNFVYKLTDVPLDPGQQKDVTVGIHIPEGTAPGAYYGVIRYKAVPLGAAASGQGKVALTASVGTIVLITVPGDLRVKVQLNSVHVYRDSQDARFFFYKPNKVGVEVQNLGNGFVQPFGTLVVQNMFGKQIGSYQFNNPKQLGNVLPNSSRIFTHPISGVNQFGRYTVTANVAYGGGGGYVLAMTKTFWYVPAWMALTILAILVVLILLTIRLYVRYRRGTKRSYRR